MSNPPFRLFGTDYLNHRDVNQTLCGIMYINGWSDWLSYRIDNRVFAYVHHRNLSMWSLTELKSDGTEILWKGLPIDELGVSFNADDHKLFNPPTINLVSEPHVLLLDIVEYTKNIINQSTP